MKNLFFLVPMLLLSFFVYSQSQSDKDDKNLKFGFNLGVNYSNLQSKETLPVNAKIDNGLGFSVGIIMDYKFNDHFSFSPKSEIAFNNSNVEFEQSDNSIHKYEIFPASLNLMTHFVYKIGKCKTVPYILVGPNVKIPISKKPDSSLEFYTKSDFAIDFGIGISKKAKYFTWSPELRYSWGFSDVNLNPALKSLNFHNISLIVNFI